MNMIYHSTSLEETHKIAGDFASTLKGGEVILLQGELGAGKTSFSQGLVKALGSDDLVRSPTFTVMNIYKGEGKVKEIVHLDLYRFEQMEDIADLGLEEWIGREDVVMLIEWPKGAILHADHIIKLKMVDETTREIEIS